MERRIRTKAGLIALLVAGIALFLVAPGSAGAQGAVTIAVGDNWFCDSSFQGGTCETEVGLGDTVTWDFAGASLPHTTTACGDDCDNPTSSPRWDSGVISDGSTFQVTFDQPGTYLYRCNVHPTQMRGQIVVQAAQDAPAPTETVVEGVATATPEGAPPPAAAEEAASPTATPESGDQGALPSAGVGPGGGSSANWWFVAALASAGAAVIGVAVATRRWLG
jgi:plastocyanin